MEFVFEVFAEEYTTNYGVRTSDASDKLYYLIPLVSDGYIENFVTLEATPRYYDTLDQIYDETWDPELPEVYTELYLEMPGLSISLPTLKISSMIGAKLESFIKTAALWIGALNPTFSAQATRR